LIHVKKAARPLVSVWPRIKMYDMCKVRMCSGKPENLDTSSREFAEERR
jgi:hypothetical protein